MAPTFNGLLIKRAREAAGVSRPQLARHLGVTHRAVRAWETSERRPTAEMVASIAAALNITVGSLYGENGPDPVVAGIVASWPILSARHKSRLAAILASGTSGHALDERQAS